MREKFAKCTSAGQRGAEVLPIVGQKPGQSITIGMEKIEFENCATYLVPCYIK